MVLSDSVRRYNEDTASVMSGAAWVLDGATGVTDETYTDAPSDGCWYVRAFDDYLQKNILDRSATLTEHVSSAIFELREQFSTIAPIESIDAAAEPSATGAIVRWDESSLEYYVLCDSTVLVVNNGDIDTYETDRRIDDLETEQREQLHQLKRQGNSLEEARQQLMPELRENRRRKNTPGTYWVLSFDQAAATEGLTGTVSLTSTTTVYLFTDGFDRLVNIYNAYSDWEAAIDTVQKKGVEATVDELRSIEREDPQADDHLRLKKSDDTTVVQLRFETA
ncbi:hypothetical protein EXE51_15815 [Halorubrum sp. CGM5_25_10-8B]|uniref:hypothetical protein n=1 Tax=Halorubrum sp. CGM5_25_10-8B TaxID=2518115 RepID=UPI0010F69B4F|nr:hypothetical protein [Halorubrum sp. CGM5_25_10-8B]TKX35140.1 hypothetical protein EXE51_15815 [Halorubrum sp. CGM5_25_10-8B]